MIYWMWRPFDTGLQLLGRGLVDYQGDPTERYDTARKIGQALCSLGVMKPRAGHVGVLYDPLNDDYSKAIVGKYGGTAEIDSEPRGKAYKDHNDPCARSHDL